MAAQPNYHLRQQAAELYQQGLTAEEVGARLGRSKSAICTLLKRSGVETRKGRSQPVVLSTLGFVRMPMNIDRTWCAQCERLVKKAEADACASQFCKAKAAG